MPCTIENLGVAFWLTVKLAAGEGLPVADTSQVCRALSKRDIPISGPCQRARADVQIKVENWMEEQLTNLEHCVKQGAIPLEKLPGFKLLR